LHIHQIVALRRAARTPAGLMLLRALSEPFGLLLLRVDVS
jgi:hypothetical protein